MSKPPRRNGTLYDEGRKNLVINVALLDQTVNKTLPETLSRLATKAELNAVESSLRSEIKEGHARLDVMNTEIKEIRTEIKEIRTEIKEIRTDMGTMHARIEATHTRIEAGEGTLRAEIKQSAMTQICWTVGLIIALAGLLVMMQTRQEDRLDKRIDELKQLVIQSLPVASP